MSAAFKLVARIGPAGDRYPHILVDAHGWALRLGPSYRQDEKYYSSLPSLFEGLVEHFLRRRLSWGPANGLEALAREVRAGMKELRDLATTYLENSGNGMQPRPVDATHNLRPARGTPSRGSAPGTAYPARKRASGGNG